jgi:hypothetical protein
MSRRRLFSLSRHPSVVAYALLLICVWLQFSSLPLTSPTMDEGLHLVRGYAFVTQGDQRMRLRGPIFPNLLSGAALRLLEPGLQLLPNDDPAWLDTEGADLAERFVWDNTSPPLRIVFVGRLPILFVGLILGAFVYRWAAERSGGWPAVGALALYTFSPNLLAHTRLATTDTVTAAMFLISAYAFSRALARSNFASQAQSGIAFGLAMAAKFSATALLASFVVQALLQVRRDWRQPGLRWSPIIAVLTTLGVGGLTLWAVHGFSTGPIEPGGLSLPAPLYWAEWRALQIYVAGNQITPGYLFGAMSPRGWWYYYPITFLVKTSLPILILMILAWVHTWRTRAWQRDLPLWLPPLFLFASLLASPHDIGYRYLLPILPFVCVASADLLAALWRVPKARVLIGLLVGWQVLGTLNIYPYYLTFFNEIAGGPERGRYILSDSNIDWGQDLAGLKNYVDQQRIDRIKLSYFGTTHPAAYGLKTEALPPVRSAMRDQSAWWLHTYYPSDPPPGMYAISVVNLMGGIWTDQGAYAFFRDRAPDTTIGNSIYVYTIDPRGPAADLSLAGLQIDQIDPETYKHFNTNDVRPRWYDATSSLIAAPGESWIAIADDQPIAPEFKPLFTGVEPVARTKLTDEDRSYALYHFDLATRLQKAASRSNSTVFWSPQTYPDASSVHTLTLPIKFGEAAQLMGYQLLTSTRSLTLTTYWQAGDSIVPPLQLFVHALAPDGSIVAQEDRLDASAYGWRAGDLIAQINHLALPDQSVPVWIEVGLYNQDSGDRLPVVVDKQQVDQRLLLMNINPIPSSP